MEEQRAGTAAAAALVDSVLAQAWL